MITLIPLPPEGESQRFFIRLGDRHAGGITVYRQGQDVTYGIAIAPAMRRRGIAKAALLQLFARLLSEGVQWVRVRIRQDNAASLALHRSLGFVPVSREGEILCLEKALSEEDRLLS